MPGRLGSDGSGSDGSGRGSDGRVGLVVGAGAFVVVLGGVDDFGGRSGSDGIGSEGSVAFVGRGRPGRLGSGRLGSDTLGSGRPGRLGSALEGVEADFEDVEGSGGSSPAKAGAPLSTRVRVPTATVVARRAFVLGIVGVLQVGSCERQRPCARLVTPDT
jgi:hypothetical protein